MGFYFNNSAFIYVRVPVRLQLIAQRPKLTANWYISSNHGDLYTPEYRIYTKLVNISQGVSIRNCNKRSQITKGFIFFPLVQYTKHQ